LCKKEKQLWKKASSREEVKKSPMEDDYEKGDVIVDCEFFFVRMKKALASWRP
jgi:hypothetical protein